MCTRRMQCTRRMHAGGKSRGHTHAAHACGGQVTRPYARGACMQGARHEAICTRRMHAGGTSRGHGRQNGTPMLSVRDMRVALGTRSDSSAAAQLGGTAGIGVKSGKAQIWCRTDLVPHRGSNAWIGVLHLNTRPVVLTCPPEEVDWAWVIQLHNSPHAVRTSRFSNIQSIRNAHGEALHTRTGRLHHAWSHRLSPRMEPLAFTKHGAIGFTTHGAIGFHQAWSHWLHHAWSHRLHHTWSHWLSPRMEPLA